MWNPQSPLLCFQFSLIAGKLKHLQKFRFFSRKSIKGVVAVSARLLTRGIRNYDGCLLCGAEEESINHILFLCPYARQVWALSNFPTPPGGFGSSDVENFKYLFSLRNNELLPTAVRTVFPWIVWLLWKNKNTLLFDGSLAPADLVVRKAYEDSSAWSAAQVPPHTVASFCSQQQNHWSPPLRTEVKCNIGFSW